MKPLTNDLELHTVAVDQREIFVFLGKESLGNGLIKEITKTAIKIDDIWYMRSNCSFWVQNKRL
jgi:hypothetical protein